jgi:hypothetical protein
MLARTCSALNFSPAIVGTGGPIYVYRVPVAITGVPATHGAFGIAVSNNSAVAHELARAMASRQLWQLRTKDLALIDGTNDANKRRLALALSARAEVSALDAVAGWEIWSSKEAEALSRRAVSLSDEISEVLGSTSVRFGKELSISARRGADVWTSVVELAVCHLGHLEAVKTRKGPYKAAGARLGGDLAQEADKDLCLFQRRKDARSGDDIRRTHARHAKAGHDLTIERAIGQATALAWRGIKEIPVEFVELSRLGVEFGRELELRAAA